MPIYRNDKRVKEWKDNIFKRDDYRCQHCGSRVSLVAHHIISWEESEELRIDLDNGLTLCKSCHTTHHLKVSKLSGKKVTKTNKKMEMKQASSLKALRQVLYMTQEEICKKIGCSPAAYSLWERGKHKMTAKYRIMFWELALKYKIKTEEAKFFRD